MRARHAVGIAGYGAYVPRFRVETAAISAAWRPRGAAGAAVAEKSVPGPDEDVVTMGTGSPRFRSAVRCGWGPSRSHTR